MGDRRHRCRARRRDGAAGGDALSRFARTPLFRIYVSRRLQGEQRRIQTDGARALRGTAIRRPDLFQPAETERRWVVRARSTILRLPRRVANDESEIRSIVRRATPTSGCLLYTS